MPDLTVEVPLPSPLIGGRARRGDPSSEPVMSAIEEFRAIVTEETRAALVGDADGWWIHNIPISRPEAWVEWRCMPTSEPIPDAADRYIRQGLADQEVIQSPRALLGRVIHSISEVDSADEEGLVITVSEEG